MNNGAITLSCPACGSVFLTLQQGGALEICPHCANSAPRSAYSIEQIHTSSRDATIFPQKKRIKSVEPLPDTRPPEPAPEFVVVAATPPPAPPPSPPERQPAVFAPAPPITPQVQVEPQPAWPGLGVPGAPSDPQRLAKAQRSLVTKSSQPTAQPETNSVGPSEQSLEVRPASSGCLGFLMFLSFVALCTIGWFLVNQPSEFKAAAPVKPAPQAPAAEVLQAPKPELQDPHASEPAIEMRRAVPASSDKPAAPAFQITHAGAVVEALEKAKTLDERLLLIDSPSRNRESVESFFKQNDNSLRAVRVEGPTNRTDIATGATTPLFRLITEKCPVGAMVRLIAKPDGEPALDWPLFIQSHSLSFDKFVKKEDPDAPKTARFTAIMQRSRDFELPEPERSAYDSFLAQGSLSKEGTSRVYVAKNSPAGRLLSTRMTWGETYFVEILLGEVEIASKPVLVVLECGDGISGTAKLKD